MGRHSNKAITNMKFNRQALTKSAEKAFCALKDTPFIGDFYLAGGTGAALLLGHRVSVDLDLFSEKNPLTFRARESIKTYLRKIGAFKVQSEEDGTLHIVFHGTSVSFLRYSYPLLRKPVKLEGVSIASLEDIALMKIGAIIGRGSKKDFIDLYSICRKYPLGDIFKLSKKKFPDSRDFALEATRALVYFEDAEKETPPRLLKPLQWKHVRDYFEKEAIKAAKGILQDSD
ncbi:nucleotidyl transferase AbiEii/AbiGii toxin family protein [Elusimicrobiota bacterium]